MIGHMGDEAFPVSKGWIQAMCLILTPLCGAFLYYALRAKYPAAAKYANRMSWISWLVWIVLAFGGHRAHLLW
jgi:hypothetical protein